MPMKQKNEFLMKVGLLLVAAALLLTAWNYAEDWKAWQESLTTLEEMQAVLLAQREGISASDRTTADGYALLDEKTKENAETLLPEFLLNPNREMPESEINGQKYIGRLEIPALNLVLPVMSEWSYPRLRRAPCRYIGSAYSRDMIVCGHNYNRHFGGLKNLVRGDQVVFLDEEETVFFYEVAAIQTLAPTANEEMQSGEWDLTLFTCTVGGRSRVTVRCVLVGYEYQGVFQPI